MTMMAYVSRRPCGHPVALMVDEPDYRKDTATFVGREIRVGHTVERVTLERAREIGVTYCACVPTAEYARALARHRKQGKRGWQ